MLQSSVLRQVRKDSLAAVPSEHLLLMVHIREENSTTINEQQHREQGKEARKGRRSRKKS